MPAPAPGPKPTWTLTSAPNAAAKAVPKAEAKPPVGRFNFQQPTKGPGGSAGAGGGTVTETTPQVSATAAEAFSQAARRAVLKRHTRGTHAGEQPKPAAAPKPVPAVATKGKPSSAGRFNFEQPMKPPSVAAGGGGGGGGGGSGSVPELGQLIERIKSNATPEKVAGGVVALWAAGLAHMYWRKPKSDLDVDIHRGYISEIGAACGLRLAAWSLFLLPESRPGLVLSSARNNLLIQACCCELANLNNAGYLKGASTERDDLAELVSMVSRIEQIESHVSPGCKQANPRCERVQTARGTEMAAACRLFG
jgi:hypothetical protein